MNRLRDSLGTWLMVLGLLVAMPLAGCTVDQTENGNMPDVDVNADEGEMPEVEVVEEGEMPDLDVDVRGGNLPEFDVDWADIDIGLGETQIEVPKIDVYTETENVRVPMIDIDWPGTERVVERQLDAEVELTEPGYRLQIEEVYGVRDGMVVIAELYPASANMDRTRLADTIVVNAPEMDVRYYLITSNPELIDDEGDFEVVTSMREIDEDLRRGRQLYGRTS